MTNELKMTEMAQVSDEQLDNVVGGFIPVWWAKKTMPDPLWKRVQRWGRLPFFVGSFK